MKKALLLFAFLAFLPCVAPAQFAATIDTATASSTSYTLTEQITIPGLCTNAAATLLNTNYPLFGDPPATEGGKINDGFASAWSWSVAQSNNAASLSNAFAAFTNAPFEPQFLHFTSTNTVARDFYNFLGF